MNSVLNVHKGVVVESWHLGTLGLFATRVFQTPNHFSVPMQHVYHMSLRRETGKFAEFEIHARRRLAQSSWSCSGAGTRRDTR
jgi:hypothetical protein